MSIFRNNRVEQEQIRLITTIKRHGVQKKVADLLGSCLTELISIRRQKIDFTVDDLNHFLLRMSEVDWYDEVTWKEYKERENYLNVIGLELYYTANLIANTIPNYYITYGYEFQGEYLTIWFFELE